MWKRPASGSGSWSDRRRTLLRGGGEMTGVAAAFEKARADGRSTLVGYLPAGFPTVDLAIAAMRVMVEAGVDLVETGFRYSDPVIDGPVIQRASELALAAGTRARDVIDTVSAVASTGVPV